MRLARISFSGELAYEVYVSPWYAVAVWERLLEAGRPYGITPYGTETMHVLRAEKGYPIIGQDTDGTVTPHDLGMAGRCRRRRSTSSASGPSPARPTGSPLRKHLVGLLPDDRQTVLPEGSQIVEFCVDGQLPPPPVPMLGHVTSSYRSAELDRPFALALVKGGRSRIGETVHVPVNGTLVPVEVTGSVLVDPEGARRDGSDRSGHDASTPRFARGGRPAPDHKRTQPLEAWSDAFASCRTRSASPWSRTSRRSTSGSVILSAWPAITLPTVPNTWVPADTGYAVWLGPDEWLLTSTADAPEELEARVRAAVVPLGGSAADVSAQRIILRLTGERVRDVLAKGCSIDLHPRAFGRGSSAQTTLGQAGVVLLALSDAGDDYLILVRSSFAGYLADWLLDASLEFTST